MTDDRIDDDVDLGDQTHGANEREGFHIDPGNGRHDNGCRGERSSSLRHDVINENDMFSRGEAIIHAQGLNVFLDTGTFSARRVGRLRNRRYTT